MSNKTHAQFSGLDILRFFAAAVVMLYHLTYCAWAAPGAPIRFGAASDFVKANFGTLFDFGWVGVEIFFVISGFVIALSCENATPTRFVRSRLLRLLPAMWIAAILLTLLAILFKEDSTVHLTVQFFSSLAFQPVGPWASPVFWTLQVEMVFYLLVYLMLVRAGFGYIESLALWIGGASLAFWAAFAIFQLVPIEPFQDLLLRASRHQVLAVILLRQGIFFAVGIYLWAIYARGWSMRRTLALAVFGLASVGEIIDHAIETSIYMKTPLNIAPPLVLWLVAVLVIYLSSTLASAGRPTRFAAIARVIGRMTFPLYLLHEKVGAYFLIVSSPLGISNWLGLALSLVVPSLLSLAVAVYAEPLIRPPLGRFIDKLGRDIAAARRRRAIASP